MTDTQIQQRLYDDLYDMCRYDDYYHKLFNQFKSYEHLYDFTRAAQIPDNMIIKCYSSAIPTQFNIKSPIHELIEYIKLNKEKIEILVDLHKL